MKKVLLSLLLGGLAASAMAQLTPPAARSNVLVIGAHVLKTNPTTTPGQDTAACPDNPSGATNAALAGATCIPFNLQAPTDVAGLQFKLEYDPAVVTIVDPTGTDFDSTEGQGSVIKNPSAVVNYAAATTDPAHSTFKSINIALAASKGTTKSGQVLRIWAKPTAGAKAGASSPFILSPTASDFVVSDSKANAITTATALPGSLIIGGANSWSTNFPTGVWGSVSLGAAPGGTGTALYVVDNDGILHVHDPATGAAVATGFTAPAAIAGVVAGRPAVNAGTIAVGSSSADGKSGAVNIYQANGTLVANAAVGGAVYSTPAILNGNVYATSADGKIQAFNATTGAPVGTAQSLGAVANGVGYSSPSASGPAGSTNIWVGGNAGVFEFSADLTPQKTIAVTGVVQGPVNVNGAFGYAGSDNGSLVSFDATGTLGATVDTTAPITNGPYVMATGDAFTVNTAGQITHATFAAGQNLVKLGAGSDFFSSPIVTGDIATGGTLWVGDTAGVLHAISVTAAGATNPLDISVTGGGQRVTSPATDGAGNAFVAGQDGSVISVSTQ